MANEPLDENTLTTEQALTLEQARIERVQAELALHNAKAQTAQVAAEHKDLLVRQHVTDVFAECGIKFYEPALVEKLARSQFDLRFADDGSATGLVGGKRVTLKVVLEEIARKHPTLTDGRTTRHLQANEEPPVKARDQMSRAEKIDFIDRFGLSAWEKLPAHSVQMTEIRTLQDYARLPVATKTALLAKHGLPWLERLPRK